MNKALCVTVLLLGFALLVKSSDTTSASSTSPVIIAKGAFVNRTTPIPTTTIFTPQHTGLYRLSVYMTATKNDGSSWYYNFNWSDDAGAENASQVNLNNSDLLYLHAGNIPPVAFAYSDQILQPGSVVPFEAIAGVPVTYTVTQSPVGSSGTYSLYYTVERLE